MSAIVDQFGKPIVPDKRADEIIKPLEEEYTDEEILFWSTPYFDELQEEKAKRQEAMKRNINED
jgi:hypothetical protein